jgi:hypothetical protein
MSIPNPKVKKLHREWEGILNLVIREVRDILKEKEVKGNVWW